MNMVLSLKSVRGQRVAEAAVDFLTLREALIVGGIVALGLIIAIVWDMARRRKEKEKDKDKDV